jgi:RND family efflux transporter MFP subunit
VNSMRFIFRVQCNLYYLTCLVATLTVLSNPFACAQELAVVTAVEVKSGSITSTVKLVGSVKARRYSVLSAELAGLVSNILVDEGDVVGVGEPLLRLREQPARLQVEFEQAGVQRGEAEVKLATLRERRQGELFASKVIAQHNYDLAEAELSGSLASKTAASARLALANDQLQRHVINAPFGGVISRKLTEVGSWVRPGDALLELAEMATLRINAPLPERYFNQVVEGSEVVLEFAALKRQPIAATLTKKVTVANSTSRTFPLLIDIPNPGNLIAPGMSVDVIVNLSDNNDPVLLVPVDALVRQSDGSTILWMISREEPRSVLPVAVQTGRNQGQMVEIVGGEINAGDSVVQRGNERMRPGLSVRVVTGQ